MWSFRNTLCCSHCLDSGILSIGKPISLAIDWCPRQIPRRFLFCLMSSFVCSHRVLIFESFISLMFPGPGQITMMSDVLVIGSKSAVFTISTSIPIVVIIRESIFVKLSSLSMMVAVFHLSSSQLSRRDCSRKWNLERCSFLSQSFARISGLSSISWTSGGVCALQRRADLIPPVFTLTSWASSSGFDFLVMPAPAWIVTVPSFSKCAIRMRIAVSSVLSGVRIPISPP